MIMEEKKQVNHLVFLPGGTFRFMDGEEKLKKISTVPLSQGDRNQSWGMEVARIHRELTRKESASLSKNSKELHESPLENLAYC